MLLNHVLFHTHFICIAFIHELIYLCGTKLHTKSHLCKNSQWLEQIVLHCDLSVHSKHHSQPHHPKVVLNCFRTIHNDSFTVQTLLNMQNLLHGHVKDAN